MWNYLSIMLISGIGAVVFAYIGFLSWFRVEQFREMLDKRYEKYISLPFNHYFRQWGQSKSYLWFVRIQTLVAFVILTGIFLMGIIGPIFFNE